MTHWIEIEIERWAKRCPAGGRLLDVGCGLRPYEKCFPAHAYVGLDVGESGRTAAEKRADVYYDGRGFPFAGASFDAVLFTEVLEHCQAPDLVLGEIVRVLKPNGLLLLTVPFMWGEHEQPFDFQRYTLFGLGELLQRHGLRVVESKRLMQGISALEIMVRSEIAYHEHVHRGADGIESRWRRHLKGLSAALWRCQLRLWQRLYRFDRIYLDNFVVAEKPPTPA